MTKMERRIKNFSSGIKQLSNDKQEFIHKLTHYLFIIEKLSACSIHDKKSLKLETSAGKKENEKASVIVY